MEKALIFSDLHVHPYRQFNEGGRRLKNCISFIEYMFKLAHANNIELLIMPGDLHNLMQIVSVKAVNAVISCLKHNFDTYPEIIVVAISGNHDYSEINLLDKPAESALEHLSEIFPRFILLDHNYLYNTKGGSTILGIPYYEHAEHFRVRLGSTEIQDTFDSKVFLLVHQTIGSGLPIEDDITPEDPLFDNFTMIFNGHIHESQQLTDKFINVGSPLNRDAGDIGKQKGFWIVDLDDPINTIAFKDITQKYPNFVYKTQGEELTEEDKNNYVIWKPAPIADSVKDQKLAEKFSTSLAPAVILTNYCKTVLDSKELDEKLAYGLKLI